jgi:hypothetical protein
MYEATSNICAKDAAIASNRTAELEKGCSYFALAGFYRLVPSLRFSAPFNMPSFEREGWRSFDNQTPGFLQGIGAPPSDGSEIPIQCPLPFQRSGVLPALTSLYLNRPVKTNVPAARPDSCRHDV